MNNVLDTTQNLTLQITATYPAHGPDTRIQDGILKHLTTFFDDFFEIQDSSGEYWEVSITLDRVIPWDELAKSERTLTNYENTILDLQAKVAELEKALADKKDRNTELEGWLSINAVGYAF